MTDPVRMEDVFGVQRDVPLNYVVRPAVDDAFVGALARDTHIVVHGSSKQGKTSLRKYHLRDDEYVRVMCTRNSTLAQLFSGILKEVGYTVEASTVRTVAGETKITARLQGSLGVSIAKIESEISGEQSSGESVQTTSLALELEPSNADDIVRALRDAGFNGFIVLEDFHYLPLETQEAFSTALKVFHEESRFTFIVVGVWLDENRLLQFNGDLTGRVVSVDADRWTPDELLQVVRDGERLLNISIDEDFVNRLIAGCFLSVHIVQETCRLVCEEAEVFSTRNVHTAIHPKRTSSDFIRLIVENQSARYDSFLNGFSDGFQDTSLQMYRWLLLPILSLPTSAVEQGVTYGQVRRIIDANHPAAPVNAGNVTQALTAAASLQVKQRIMPIVLDYDRSRKRLNVVDRGFLTWLNYQNRAQVRADLDLPPRPVAPDGVLFV